MDLEQFLEREYEKLNDKNNVEKIVYDFKIESDNLKNRIKRLEKISYVFNILKDSIKNGEIDEKSALELLSTNKFIELCMYAGEKFNEIHDEYDSQESGKWVRYCNNASGLIKDLKGRNTGWPFSEKITGPKKYYDYHVFYTKDEKGEFTIPRIGMIFIYPNQIKIYGVARGCYIESGMELIIERRLKEFPEFDHFENQINILKDLTNLHKKYKNGEMLNLDELKFIYELNKKFKEFELLDCNSFVIGNYGTDPRILEIIKGRNVKQDLNMIYGRGVKIRIPKK